MSCIFYVLFFFLYFPHLSFICAEMNDLNGNGQTNGEGLCQNEMSGGLNDLNEQKSAEKNRKCVESCGFAKNGQMNY